LFVFLTFFLLAIALSVLLRIYGFWYPLLFSNFSSVNPVWFFITILQGWNSDSEAVDVDVPCIYMCLKNQTHVATGYIYIYIYSLSTRVWPL
jgi:hypothetical protein